jgi:hypothetical protein
MAGISQAMLDTLIKTATFSLWLEQMMSLTLLVIVLALDVSKKL